MGVTNDVLREKGEKKKRGRRTEGELCEFVERSGKNKEQKRVKEKKEKSKGTCVEEKKRGKKK